MKIENIYVKKLVSQYREISLLNNVSALLSWDLEVNLPSRAMEARSAQSAYLTKLTSDKWLDTDFKKTLEKAQEARNLNAHEKAIVRNLVQGAKFYHRVPQETIVNLSETTSKAFFAWREAREKNKYKLFEPHLKKVIALSKIIAEHIGYSDKPYDALLDMYEPGFTTKEGKVIFGSLVKELGALLTKIKKSQAYLIDENKLLTTEYSPTYQKQIADFVLNKIGYDFSAGRMDVAAHPFTIELGAGDVRITNRYSPHNFIESVMVAMHEGGHALYEQG